MEGLGWSTTPRSSRLPFLLFPSLHSALFHLIFQAFSRASPLSHPFVSFRPLPVCLQDASAQTQQMLKGKTGAPLDAISILLKDH